MKDNKFIRKRKKGGSPIVYPTFGGGNGT